MTPGSTEAQADRLPGVPPRLGSCVHSFGLSGVGLPGSTASTRAWILSSAIWICSTRRGPPLDPIRSRAEARLRSYPFDRMLPPPLGGPMVATGGHPQDFVRGTSTPSSVSAWLRALRDTLCEPHAVPGSKSLTWLPALCPSRGYFPTRYQWLTVHLWRQCLK
jgi:hypothetical protein